MSPRQLLAGALGVAALLALATHVRAQTNAFSGTAPIPDQTAAPPLPPTLTPAAPLTPQIHGAKIFGVRPGHPLLYTIAATGSRPMLFAADGLPDGAKIDPGTGQITGAVRERGTYAVTLHARNALGEATRPLRIVVGDKIALTPPMGWNSWNCFGGDVSQAKVTAAADAMVSSGLANHGWSYVNVDDCWQVKPGSTDPSFQGPTRDSSGNILSNPRFPDMKGLADHIHALGLKAGLYSSPGRLTCGKCVGSYRHENQDARTYAAWGFDYLKYDWCSYKDIYKAAGSPGLTGMEKPYRVMHRALEPVGRDIVYSFCQYGMGDVWKWGADAGGNSWRTTDDIGDTWATVVRNSDREIGLSKYAGPGHWNDPDMLVVGQVGWGPTQHPTRLTPDEQYAHISLWALLGAPLLIGCDLTKLDAFTLGLLTNDEVLDVNQDALGKVADLVRQVSNEMPDVRVWSRPLEDGSLAVGLFNRSETKATGSISWPDLKIRGPHAVRDLWRQKDLGTFPDRFTADVPPHGVVLVKISAPVQ